MINDSKVLDLYVDGCLYLASSWTSDAIMLFEMALTRTQPGGKYYVKVTLKLVECYFKERSISQALNLLDYILELEPFNIKAILMKARYYLSFLNENESLRIIQAGVKAVEMNQTLDNIDPLYSTLVKEMLRLESLTEKYSKPQFKRQCLNIRSTSLLEKLPPELIIKIMEQLDQGSFINCLCTCRDWRSNLLRIPRLLGSFVLKQGLTLEMFNKYLNYLKEVAPLEELAIENLNIQCQKSEERKIIKKLLSCGLKVHHLNLNLSEITNFELVRLQQTICSKLFDNLISLDISLKLTTKGTKSIESVIEMCNNLRNFKLIIKNMTYNEAFVKEPAPSAKLMIDTKIEKLSINNAPGLFLMRFFNHFKLTKLTLLELILSEFTTEVINSLLGNGIIDLRIMNVETRVPLSFLFVLNYISKLPGGEDFLKRIEHIEFHNYSYHQIQREVDNETLNNTILLPKLKSLALKRDKGSFSLLMSLASRWKSLTEFSYEEFYYGGSGGLISLGLLFKSIPNLKDLIINCNYLPTDFISSLIGDLDSSIDKIKFLESFRTNSKIIIQALLKIKKLKIHDLIVTASDPNNVVTDNDLKRLVSLGIINYYTRS